MSDLDKAIRADLAQRARETTPDADARQQAVDAIERELDLARSGEGYEANAVAEEIVRRYWPDGAGLRADLDRVRAERDEFADLHCGEARTHDETIASLNAARAERDALSRMLRGMARRVGHARVSGARTIPDDAAELVAKRMLRIKLYGVALSARYDWQAHRQWTQQLTGDERADWLRDARALLADLGATPATAPAPAAAAGCRAGATSVLGSGLVTGRGAQRVEVEPERHPSPGLDDLEGDVVSVVVDHDPSVP